MTMDCSMKQNSQLTDPEPSRQPVTSLGATAQEESRAIRNVRTLIADDSPVMLKILAKILALEGNFTLVGTVTDGQQAVRQTLNMKPDLVLMDYSMPHINGIEATRSIKQFQNPPLVIIVTSNDTPECKAQAKAAGADGFVVKGGHMDDQLRSVFQGLFQFAGQTLPCPGKSKSCRLRGRSRRAK
jgi:CheY-like chemotaxis protein